MYFPQFQSGDQYRWRIVADTYENNFLKRGDSSSFYEPVHPSFLIQYINDYQRMFLRPSDFYGYRSREFYTIQAIFPGKVLITERYFLEDMDKMDVGRNFGLCDGCMNVSTHRCECGDARYCSKECQTSHWSIHCMECQM